MNRTTKLVANGQIERMLRTCNSALTERNTSRATLQQALRSIEHDLTALRRTINFNPDSNAREQQSARSSR